MFEMFACHIRLQKQSNNGQRDTAKGSRTVIFHLGNKSPRIVLPLTPFFSFWIQDMGKRLSALLWLALACSSSAPASDNEAYDACLLKYQKLAKTERSAFYIQRSCRKLHIDGNYLFSGEKKYHQCIIDNLPGVETETATSQILSVCNDQSRG